MPSPRPSPKSGIGNPTFFIQKYKLYAFCGVATHPSLFPTSQKFVPTAPNFVPTEPGLGADFIGPHISPGGAGGGVGGASAGGSETVGIRLNN